MRKRRKSKKKYAIFLIPLVIILFFSLILKSGLFNIKQIDVVGDKLGCVDESRIKISSGLYGQNFFTIDQKKLTKIFKDKFVCIRDVNLSKTFPDKVSINLAGRIPAAELILLKNKEASASSIIENIATPSAEDIKDTNIIDNEGVAFSKNTDGVFIPKVFIFQMTDKSFLQILDKIKTLGINTKESWVIENNFVVISEAPVMKIIFDLESQINVQLASLQLILDKAKIDTSELTFIDLRFDKPVVRFAPKKK